MGRKDENKHQQQNTVDYNIYTKVQGGTSYIMLFKIVVQKKTSVHFIHASKII